MDYNYEPFANDPAYRAVNLSLVELVNRTMHGGLNAKMVADIATGTGLIAKLCCEVATPRSVLCSDIVPGAVEAAKATLAPYSANTRFTFHIADAKDLPLEPGSIDALFGTNFIHNVKDKSAVFREAARTLVHGGYFAMNTAFHEECYVPGTEKLWARWVAEAWRYAKTRSLVIERDHSEITARKEWLAPQEYCQLLEASGFKVVDASQKPVQLARSALESIAKYAEFAVGAFHINPFHERGKESVSNATAALVTVVEKVFPLEGVPRNWLQIVAQKV